MPIFKYPVVPTSEITPPEVYRARRRFMQGIAAVATVPLVGAATDVQAGVKLAGVRASQYKLAENNTPYKDITTYNNFYEFGTGKDDPAERSGGFKTRPWTVSGPRPPYMARDVRRAGSSRRPGSRWPRWWAQTPSW